MTPRIRKSPRSSEGYVREAFKHWVDADGDGCDTRKEVLIEESLIPATQEAGCSVSAGEWFSPYDATTFVAPGGLDIDHVVPLAEARGVEEPDLDGESRPCRDNRSFGTVSTTLTAASP